MNEEQEEKIEIWKMLNDDEVSFNDFYSYLQVNDIGNWDRVNSGDIIRQYCSEMMNDGIHISHIVKALEKNPSYEDLYCIWLGNSMETPTPINNKEDLVEALEIELPKVTLNVKLQHKDIFPNGEWRTIANESVKEFLNDDDIYFYVDDEVNLNNLQKGNKIQLDEEFLIVEVE